MKKLLILGALALGMVGTAAADVKISELLLRKKGEDLNVRVVVTNPGARTQRGPVKVTLWVRPDGSSQWSRVKVWTNIDKIQVGHRVARDFFDENNATLRQVASQPSWEAKVQVSAPGAASDEKSEVFVAEQH
jgi:hypothetical protein